MIKNNDEVKWVVAKRPPDGLELLYTVEAVPFLSMVVAMLAIVDSRWRRLFFSNFPFFFFSWVQTKVGQEFLLLAERSIKITFHLIPIPFLKVVPRQ